MKCCSFWGHFHPRGSFLTLNPLNPDDEFGPPHCNDKRRSAAGAAGSNPRRTAPPDPPVGGAASFVRHARETRAPALTRRGSCRKRGRGGGLQGAAAGGGGLQRQSPLEAPRSEGPVADPRAPRGATCNVPLKDPVVVAQAVRRAHVLVCTDASIVVAQSHMHMRQLAFRLQKAVRFSV